MLLSALRLLRSVMLSAVLLAACSLFVEQEIKNVRCQDHGRLGPPACDAGQICGQGRCHVCETRELCGDGFDNDCNGLTEEGCGALAGTGGAGDEDRQRQQSGAAGAAGHHDDDAGSSAGGSRGWRDPFP